jgi:hypothetical protein
MQVTHESRSALSRATFFLDNAAACSGDERVEFEAYLEAAIVFARAALHRFQAKHKRHPKFKGWWDGLLADPSINFIRTERDWLLKEAPPKINQIVFTGTPSLSGDHAPAHRPTRAGDFYYFERPSVSAIATVT